MGQILKLHLGLISKDFKDIRVLLKTTSILKIFWVINDSKAEIKNYDNLEMAVALQQVHNRWIKLHFGSNCILGQIIGVLWRVRYY